MNVYWLTFFHIYVHENFGLGENSEALENL